MERVPSVQSDRVSRATFAAMLAVSNTACQCEVCTILKKVVEEIKNEFTKV